MNIESATSVGRIHMFRKSLSGISQVMPLMLGAWMFSMSSHADGLADMHAALARLSTSNPVALDVNIKLFGRSGDNKALIEREGVMNLRLEDDKNGMKVSYSNELIKQLHAEELAKIEDENVKNSALNVVGQFSYWEWRELLYPAQQMQLALERYRFLKEAQGEWNGQPARVLTFDMSKEKVDVKYRKYIRKYKNRLKIWIDEDGAPLASQVIEKGSGRVFIVIGFTFNNQAHVEYDQRAGRLIGRRLEVSEETDGTTMSSHRHFVASVSPIQ
jgi:hypothetical protein